HGGATVERGQPQRGHARATRDKEHAAVGEEHGLVVGAGGGGDGFGGRAVVADDPQVALAGLGLAGHHQAALVDDDGATHHMIEQDRAGAGPLQAAGAGGADDEVVVVVDDDGAGAGGAGPDLGALRRGQAVLVA